MSPDSGLMNNPAGRVVFNFCDVFVAFETLLGSIMYLMPALDPTDGNTISNSIGENWYARRRQSRACFVDQCRQIRPNGHDVSQLRW